MIGDAYGEAKEFVSMCKPTDRRSLVSFARPTDVFLFFLHPAKMNSDKCWMWAGTNMKRNPINETSKTLPSSTTKCAGVSCNNLL